MIQKLTLLPVTETSKPFSEAADRCHLAERGYVEEEYLFEGASNLYQSGDDGKPVVQYENVPYTNRMIVRRPADPAKSNGHVVIEITNATGHYDIERMWIISRDYFIREGVTYIGLTSKPDVFDSLVFWDKERYGALNWPNPRPQSEWVQPDARGKLRLTFTKPDQECGLFWDMLTDLPDLLRSDCALNPLRALPVKYITLTGWSQSSGYLHRYVNSFAYRAERSRPVYDGYFAAGCVFILATPLNQNEYGRRGPGMESWVQHMEQPYYAVQTESEDGSFGLLSAPRPDCDEPGRLQRVWEMAGSTHDNKRGLCTYYEGDRPIPELGYPCQYWGTVGLPNDYPYEYTMSAAYDHLFRWIETGMAPAIAPRMEHNAQGKTVLDAFGNAVGGVRTALVDLPTRRYIPWTARVVNGVDEGGSLFGREEPFSAAFLKELYGSLAAYEARVREATKKHVTQGYVLADDAEALIQECIALARAGGLE